MKRQFRVGDSYCNYFWASIDSSTNKPSIIAINKKKKLIRVIHNFHVIDLSMLSVSWYNDAWYDINSLPKEEKLELDIRDGWKF